MQSKFSTEILYPLLFKALWKANGRHYKLFETNLLMPEGVAFISNKSRVDTPRDSKVMSTARTDRQTRQMAFQLYIVEDAVNSPSVLSYFAKINGCQDVLNQVGIHPLNQQPESA